MPIISKNGHNFVTDLDLQILREKPFSEHQYSFPFLGKDYL